jgi:hypothetical protein
MKKKKEDPELEVSGVLIIKTSKGNIRQVMLSEREADAVLSLARAMHSGQLRVSEKVLEGITF